MSDVQHPIVPSPSSPAETGMPAGSSPADFSPAGAARPRPALSGPRLLGYALILDVVLVLVFAVSGRASHGESLGVSGVLETAWPFLAGLALGWLVTRNWHAPVRVWPHGACLWIITVLAGMILRVAAGGTAAVAFIVVATVVLGVFLLGHRAAASAVLRARARR